MSPPSRNQVMNMPKPRPPSPHSFRCSRSSAWRQRAAAKPTRVMTANMMMTIVSATAFPLMSVRLPGLLDGNCVLVVRVIPPRHPAEQVGDRGQDRDDRHPHELVPVEEGEVPECRGEVVVERDPKCRDHRGCQYDCDRNPDADGPAGGAVLRHDVLFRASKMGQGGPPGSHRGRARCDVCRIWHIWCNDTLIVWSDLPWATARLYRQRGPNLPSPRLPGRCPAEGQQHDGSRPLRGVEVAEGDRAGDEGGPRRWRLASLNIRVHAPPTH